MSKKRYTNYTSELRAVHFSDGSTQFLMRGQSIESDDKAARAEDGIKVVEVEDTTKRTTTRSTSKTSE